LYKYGVTPIRRGYRRFGCRNFETQQTLRLIPGRQTLVVYFLGAAAAWDQRGFQRRERESTSNDAE
jgi:hypothetical protein